MVSVASCFIHSEVRVEIVLLSCEILKKIKCLRSLTCIESDYVNHLRYIQSGNHCINTTVPITSNKINKQKRRSKSNNLDDVNNNQKSSAPNPELLKISSIDEDEVFKQVNIEKQLKIKKPKVKKTKNTSQSNTESMDESVVRKLSVDLSLKSYPVSNRCCNFLFTNQENDFFADNRRARRKSKKNSPADSHHNRGKKTKSKQTTPPNGSTKSKLVLEEKSEIKKFCAQCNQLVRVDLNNNTELNSNCECGELIRSVSE